MMYLEHALAAIVFQAIIGCSTGRWWTGAALASGYFIGREIAQAEYRWIEMFGAGLRANMPWWAPFDRRVWLTLDQYVDWIGPVVTTSGLAAFMSRK
ncbi:hypothetical protein GGR39_000313 [Novosphingobium fluoreni]|uniref:Uncharacterized protein n=1 Tax=Novosphingobium fluoreni TaxID=1391222 RepID=A0A7W6FWU0_9SPHN|nr:hypothetical protein [Novosphingobium fluoreni]MBB3938684.1 hypothetical protein [Novosphingobium fluoreni]